MAVEHAETVGIATMDSDQDVRPVARLERRSCGLAIAPGGERAALCRHEGGIAVLDLASGAEIARFEGGEEPYDRLSFAPDGSVLLGLTRDGEGRLWRQYSEAELIEDGRGVVARLQPLSPGLECRFHLRTEGCMP